MTDTCLPTKSDIANLLRDHGLMSRTAEHYAAHVCRLRAADVLEDEEACSGWLLARGVSPSTYGVYVAARRAWLAASGVLAGPAGGVPPPAFQALQGHLRAAGMPVDAAALRVRALQRAAQDGLPVAAWRDGACVRAYFAALTGRRASLFRAAWADASAFAVASDQPKLPGLERVDDVPDAVAAAFYRLTVARRLTPAEWQRMQWNHMRQFNNGRVALVNLRTGRKGSLHVPLTQDLFTDLLVIGVAWSRVEETGSAGLILPHTPLGSEPFHETELRQLRARGKCAALAEAAAATKHLAPDPKATQRLLDGAAKLREKAEPALDAGEVIE